MRPFGAKRERKAGYVGKAGAARTALAARTISHCTNHSMTGVSGQENVLFLFATGGANDAAARAA